MSIAKSDFEIAQDAVLRESVSMPADAPQICGYDFNKGIDFAALMDSYLTTGFQATNLAKAIQIINDMLAAREESVTGDETLPYPPGKKKTACTIFFGFTSNMVTCGLREAIRYVVEHNLVDCLVTSAGGVEEDLIKCLAPSYLGSFEMRGAELRRDGLNRAGNVLIPNNNYCLFEDWIMPILDKCEGEQNAGLVQWTPSKLIAELGEQIDDRSSICYWAKRNNIPIFCPAITDGSLGDMLYFHSVRHGGIKLDVVEDVRHINTMAVKSIRSGAIILGGGVVKHHINNANLMRNGSDFTVYINTGQEFNGSDSGARPDEAVSWGKIKANAEAVKVFADASLVFPLVVARTFAKHVADSENTRRTDIRGDK
uniref:deoxyhypusine synthase n=1 Tax=Parascaris univalens TaxID=6257 RepID=A0A915BY67_PARUN